MATPGMAGSRPSTAASISGTDPDGGTSPYSSELARDDDDVRAAQRLRHRVFAEDMGVDLRTDRPGRDIDEFDQHCDHLLVRERRTGEVVGTYRLLLPERAPGTKLYSEGYFDLSALARLRPSLVELGRSCVHPDHRNGLVVRLMLAGVGRYAALAGRTWLAGSAWVPGTDAGANAAAVWNLVRERHYAPPEYRVWPINRWSGSAVTGSRRPAVPPMLKGYLRLGAWVCGPPEPDVEFGGINLFVLLSLDRLPAGYRRHFLGNLA